MSLVVYDDPHRYGVEPITRNATRTYYDCAHIIEQQLTKSRPGLSLSSGDTPNLTPVLCTAMILRRRMSYVT